MSSDANMQLETIYIRLDGRAYIYVCVGSQED